MGHDQPGNSASCALGPASQGTVPACRKQQLTVQYAVGGPYNLVPNSQPPSNTLNITIGVVGDAPGMEQVPRDQHAPQPSAEACLSP